MSISKLIIGLQKQNDAMYSSLTAKNITFERTNITEDMTEEDNLKLLQEENTRLKDVVNANKPPPQPKQEKKKLDEPTLKKEIKSKEDEGDNGGDNGGDDGDNGVEIYVDTVQKFNTITNMEELKRAFFNGDYMVFEEQIKSNPFKFYKVSYKYDSDKDGVPDFSAKNLLKGFVRNFDDYRKYFMICFRCWKNQHEVKYKYDSYWIVNTNEPISNVIGSLAEDFDFVEIITDIDDFISKIKKLPQIESDEPLWINDFSCIGESYVH
jgi:hypothetical protein